MADISVIIPAWNEEKHIASCLEAIKIQGDDHVVEVIVADHFSDDKTREIANHFAARVVDGGRPARGRNSGAAVATGEYLLFVDADTVLLKGFIEHSLQSFEKKGLGVASFFLSPMPFTIGAAIVFGLYNVYGWLASRLNCPIFNTAGCCLLVKRDLHNKIGGFDEEMIVLEEYDYIRRIKKIARFRVLPFKVRTSVRRFSNGNSIMKTVHLFRYYFQWLRGKKITKDRYDYWEF